MRVATLISPREIIFEERDLRELKHNEVRIKVLYAGIAGTDLRIYSGILKPNLLIVLGQEFVGEVKEVGDSVEEYSKGDLVVVEPVIRCGRCEYYLTGRYNLCNELKVMGVTTDGGFAEEVTVPAYTLYKIPDSVDVREAVLINPASVAFYAVKKAGVSFGDRVAVLGGGPIGLSAVQFAVGSGAEVFLIEPMEKRRAFAEKNFGIKALSPEDAKELSGRMDVVIEASGNPSALNTAVDIVKKGGKIAIAGAFGEECKLNFTTVVRKDLVISGVWLYPNIFRKVIDTLERRKISLKPYITHEFRFDEFKEAFETALSEDAIKVLLRF